MIINGFEARLMRFIYKTKYSKKNQENLSAKEEGDNNQQTSDKEASEV